MSIRTNVPKKMIKRDGMATKPAYTKEIIELSDRLASLAPAERAAVMERTSYILGARARLAVELAAVDNLLSKPGRPASPVTRKIAEKLDLRKSAGPASPATLKIAEKLRKEGKIR